MNNQSSHVQKKSEPEENNCISSHTETSPPRNLKETPVTARKRSHSLHQNHSSASPMKKTRTSSIRAGLEKTEAAEGNMEAAPGLFQYFKKATEEERKEYLARMDEEIETRLERENFYSLKAKRERETRIWNQNRDRKRRQRMRMKNLEIKSGLRSPGGTKHQVRLTIQCYFCY